MRPRSVVSWCNFTPLQLGELLEEFSFDYELDPSKVSQLINTFIEEALVSYCYVTIATTLYILTSYIKTMVDSYGIKF